jgi:pSer/pThr/pTyr-binding forkhead associated (FHA) protein/HAMP domain-containing protein
MGREQLSGKSVDKLIINHGERVTEHELGDQPIVIGRDPECDLFFADKKLSRHHARVERVGSRVRLVDLGSRNGSWVNEQRVDDREVSPGDEIRLGGLLIHIERATPPAREEEESTIYLGGSTPDDSGTVVLDAPARDSLAPPGEPAQQDVDTATIARAEPPAADDSATVFLQADAPPPEALPAEEGDETLKRPEPERTVVLPGQAKRSPYDTGTVVFRGQVDPSLQEAATRLAAPESATQEASFPDDPQRSYPSLSDSMELSLEAEALPATGQSWTFRFALVASGLALFAILVLALPLLRIVRVAGATESEKRARVLVELLAALNEQALGEGRTADLALERVAGEDGVRAAYIISPTEEILAPAGEAGRKLAIEGVEGAGEVRSPRMTRAADGDGVFLSPLSYRGRRVGVAVVRHRPEGSMAGGAAVALAFGTLLLMVAVVGAVLLAARMTLGPMEELRGDVDAVSEGRANSLSWDRPYAELSRLAASVGRLARKSRP